MGRTNTQTRGRETLKKKSKQIQKLLPFQITPPTHPSIFPNVTLSTSNKVILFFFFSALSFSFSISAFPPTINQQHIHKPPSQKLHLVVVQTLQKLTTSKRTPSQYTNKPNTRGFLDLPTWQRASMLGQCICEAGEISCPFEEVFARINHYM